MIYLCCDERRRNAVLDREGLNGIHFLEVLDQLAPEEELRQRTLLVRFLKAIENIDTANLRIEGGERITGIQALWAAPASDLSGVPMSPAEQAFFGALPDPEELLLVRTDRRGDFSTYTLRLVDSDDSDSELMPPAGFDPLLAAVDFSFKVECPSEFDCLPEPVCPVADRTEPDINYLAKDYRSFRRLLLDRMTQLVPEWRERSPADLGVVLVELLANVADQLSYQQDAVATEAYLGTARRRVSVRRHARLVDYPMHDGCNARAWVHVSVEASGVELAKGTRLLSRVSGQPPRIAPGSRAIEDAMRQHRVVFETMHPAVLHREHNRLRFYTWGEQRCCLPRGATRATLMGPLPNLKPCGDILLFEEVRGPDTGRPEDADPKKRHPVRLVEVQPLSDPLTNQSIVEIRWHDEDALPFPLCLSARLGENDALVEDVSVARGNLILADYGLTIEEEQLEPVPAPHLELAPEAHADRCETRDRRWVPARYRPRLQQAPLTQAAPNPYPELDAAAEAAEQEPDCPPASARAAMQWRPGDAGPAIALTDGSGEPWEARRDLLSSGRDGRHFVAEIEHDGAAYLRFATPAAPGEDEAATNGKRPVAGSTFRATYRIGNGAAGNIGADALAHVVSSDGSLVGVRNPLPAQGGTDPETIERVRKHAPWAYRTQERAVTPADYAEASKRHPDVQRAAATFRWTGSWHTVFVTVDRFAGRPVDPDFEDDMRRHLEPFRMAGYDLEVDGPRYVPLELDLQVCVRPDWFRSDVERALQATLGSLDLPDGRRGLFHPDNFTFGQPVYVSAVYAAAQRVQGVDSLRITRFHRFGKKSPKPPVEATLAIRRLEIARLDNDRNFPEHGVLRLQMQGGK